MKPLRVSVRLVFCVGLFIFFLSEISVFAEPQTAPVSGLDVYQKRCASCHDQAGSRAPTREVLQKLPASRILRTLDFGLMMSLAYPMKREEREAVAREINLQRRRSLQSALNESFRQWVFDVLL